MPTKAEREKALIEEVRTAYKRGDIMSSNIVDALAAIDRPHLIVRSDPMERMSMVVHDLTSGKDVLWYYGDQETAASVGVFTRMRALVVKSLDYLSEQGPGAPPVTLSADRMLAIDAILAAVADLELNIGRRPGAPGNGLVFSAQTSIAIERCLEKLKALYKVQG